MTYLSHPDDLAIPSISSRWLLVDALCHPDDLSGVGISSGWVTANSLCHLDDILFHFMSSGWLNWGWFLIRMSYGNVIMSSRWDTFPFLNHPDEIANFDFPQHAVALQRFRTYYISTHCKLLYPKCSHICFNKSKSMTSSLLVPYFCYDFTGVLPVDCVIKSGPRAKSHGCGKGRYNLFLHYFYIIPLQSL